MNKKTFMYSKMAKRSCDLSRVTELILSKEYVRKLPLSV